MLQEKELWRKEMEAKAQVKQTKLDTLKQEKDKVKKK